MDPKLAKSKALHLLKENDDFLKGIAEEIKIEVSSPKIEAETEFDLARKYYFNEGIKEGVRRFIQKINEYASRNI